MNSAKETERDGNRPGSMIRDCILVAWCVGCFAYFYVTHRFVDLIANMIKTQ